MNVTALMADLGQRGVELVANGDRLRWRAPEGVMTPETIEMLRRHKAEVMATISVRLPTGLTVSQNIDQTEECPAGGTIHHRRPRPALSPVALTAIYSVSPGDEWLADSWYALRSPVVAAHE